MQTKPEVYWERAGDVSYAQAMFSSTQVERHINGRLWQTMVDIGKQLGLNENSHVLDLGCGDGAFANLMLSQHFRQIDGFDLSEAGIRRATNAIARPGIRFEACDITRLNYSTLPRYDGIFLYGILHHVKKQTPELLSNLRKITDRIIVLEPNGNHIVRKLLELTPTYKGAGEDSFRTRELECIFNKVGFDRTVWKRMNVFPNFMPAAVFRLLKHVEPIIERNPMLWPLCTVNLWGFTAKRTS